MPLHALGINHHSAPLEVREKLAFPPELVGAALADLLAQPGVAEAVLVSTCNRTEVYCRAEDPATVHTWLTRQGERAGVRIADRIYRHDDEAAIRHAFRVASGLDSMSLGEPQILGQVKQAVRHAEQAGGLGTLLGRVFQQTFAVAKQVRTDTALGAQSISMTAAALKLAQGVFGDLSRTRLLLVGVGEIVELAATYFAAQQPQAIVVANRTIARAESFAEKLRATAVGLDALHTRLHEFDIVVSGTAATEPILTRSMFEAALKARRRRPMFVVDLAVPRDVEASVSKLEDVFLYTIDDLGHIARQGVESRQAAIDDAEAIVTQHVHAFRAWQGSRAAAPAIVELRRRAEGYRDAELARARARLARGEDPAAVLEALAKGLANKFLHHPTQALSRAPDGEREDLVRAIERLYPDTQGVDSGQDA